jgi:hypothetical protein
MIDREPRNRDKETSNRSEGQLTTKDLAAGSAAGRARSREADENAVSHSTQVSGNSEALFDNREAEDFRSDWNTIQTQFVDEPRRSVQQADELVAQTMKRLAEIFAKERETLEQGWDRGDNVSTEDLRVALQRYRSFFDRLLTV